VDPGTICDGGRTQEEFDRDGTGYALLFQNGETPEAIYKAPLNATAAEAIGVIDNIFQLQGFHDFLSNNSSSNYPSLYLFTLYLDGLV